MRINELLACITQDARDFVKKSFNRSSKADLQKLKKLFDEKRFEAKSFEDTDLDIVIFDWQSLDRDRNWWWQLQALPFLNWYANSFTLQSEEQRARYFSLCLDAIHNWVNQAKRNKASPLVWHDHAAAFRVRNLTNWLVFCHSSDLPLVEEPYAELLGSLLIEHLDWLQEDKHYSKHTNHGFDQAMIALTIPSMFDRDDFDAYRQRNRERLKAEITFAFTDEGVHKENSPGYQKMMLGRLKQLITLAPLGEEEVSHMGERYIEKAEAFLRAVTLPNGHLPMIGDTRGGDAGLQYEQKRRIDVIDYSASGYVIIRGADGNCKEFFLLFKNAHESNYHRHDDDLMLYLFYDGETVLGDSGLLSYNEKDPKRIFLRSHFAHSVPYMRKSAVRKVQNLSSKPCIRVGRDGTVDMLSSMFGVKIRRSVRLNLKESLRISILDSTCDGADDELFVNFILPRAHKVAFCEGSICASFKAFSCVIQYSDISSKIVKGWNELDNQCSAICSYEYSKMEEAYRILAGPDKIISTEVVMNQHLQ